MGYDVFTDWVMAKVPTRRGDDVISANLMFHLASGLLLVALIYRLLQLQLRLSFHEQLWRSLDSRSAKAIMVDWPQRFFSRLCQAWTIPLHGETKDEKAQKIDLQVWVQCHIELGIRGIERGEGDTLRIRVARPDPSGEWEQKLAAAMAGRWRLALLTET